MIAKQIIFTKYTWQKLYILKTLWLYIFQVFIVEKLECIKKHKVEKKITQNPSTQDMDDIFSLHPSMLILA